MSYHLFDETDFALDHSFIQWVNYPDAANILFWESWLQQHPEKRETVAQARQLVWLLSRDADALEEAELQAIWERLPLPAATGKKRRETTTAPLFPLRYLQSRSVLSAAAVGLLFLLSAVLLFMLAFPATTVYATSYGQKQHIRLPDGSLVVLNANSRLVIPAEWPTDKARQVSLEGEAYFLVAHTPNNQKFQVTTQDGLQVEVLGTEFNVSTRGAFNQVVLQSGKVRLHLDNSAHPMEMQPGQLVQVSETSGQVVAKQVRPELYTAWKDNKLLLDNTPLAAVAQLLEHTYGCRVVFRDPELARLRLSASLQTGSLDNLLAILSETLSLHITREGRQLLMARQTP
jgi:transmembrane sensor